MRETSVGGAWDPAAMASRAFIGTSGYVYPHWRHRFYPGPLRAAEWLPFYARHFTTVELNNSFYRLPAAETFAAWRDAVPGGFAFSVKASRFITHVKKLKEPDVPIRLLLGRARTLGPALGPVLFQLPGRFHLDLDRLERFLAALSRQRLVPGLRAVLEVRHASWLAPEAIARLEKANVALCLADWPELRVGGPVTADFVYLRRHGPEVRYGGSYPAARLRADARAIRRWLREGRDVYAYFNNDQDACAVRDARRLLELMTPGRRAPAAVLERRATQSPSLA